MQTVCTHVFALEEVTGIVAHGKRHGDAAANVFSLDCTLILHVHNCQLKTQWLYAGGESTRKVLAQKVLPFGNIFRWRWDFAIAEEFTMLLFASFHDQKILSDNTRKRLKLYKWVNETVSRNLVGPRQRTGFAYNDEETHFTSPIRKPASVKSQFSIPVTERFADKPVRWQSVRRWQLTVE